VGSLFGCLVDVCAVFRVGIYDGCALGVLVNCVVGPVDDFVFGSVIGCALGPLDGFVLGFLVGALVDFRVGLGVGCFVLNVDGSGDNIPTVGCPDSVPLGKIDGSNVLDVGCTDGVFILGILVDK